MNAAGLGLTSDSMIEVKCMPLRNYMTRKKNLMQYIGSRYSSKYTVLKLDEPFGPTTSEDFDYIVVSPETTPVAGKINDIRKEKGMRPIEIVVVDFVVAHDDLPISSTRIKQGEIDDHGNLIS